MQCCFNISMSEHCSGSISSLLHSSNCSGVGTEVELDLAWAIDVAVKMLIARTKIDHAASNTG
jgi:hypothetical protein